MTSILDDDVRVLAISYSYELIKLVVDTDVVVSSMSAFWIFFENT